MTREDRRATMYHGRKTERPILEYNRFNSKYETVQNPRRFEEHPMVSINPLGIVFGYIIAQNMERRN